MEGKTPVYKNADGTVYRTGVEAPVVNATANGYRLPSEKEWEWAARGGQKTQGYDYSGSSTIGDVAWYGNNSDGVTHEVGKLAANELGTYDMSGNVLEWCFDAVGSFRVFRGGSRYFGPTDCAVGRRNYDAPVNSDNHYGFRLALSLVP